MGWGTTEDVHAVGFVAVLGVGAGDVDVPASVYGVEFWCPDVGGVGGVWWWAPFYFY